MQPKLVLTWLVQWRWAPCLALVVGSAAFALSAAAFIPEELGKGSEAGASSELGAAPAIAAPAGVDETPSFASRPRTAAVRAARAAPAALGNDAVQSIFHSQPTMDLPVAPPDPDPPPPPPPPPPLPPPTSTTFTLPEPPPPPPPPPPVDQAPPVAPEPGAPNAAAPEAEDEEADDGAPEPPP